VRRALTALRIVIVLAAAAAAVVPLPAAQVERYYADALYPALQTRLTAWSNTTGLSLFDLLIASAGIGLLAAWIHWLRRARRERSFRVVAGGIGTTVTVAAAMYLWFLLAWGFNYARSPLEEAIGYDARRVTPQALRALAERATDEVNRAYAAGHAAGFVSAGERPPELATALHEVERRLGRPSPTMPSRPKRTLLGVFFKSAGVDGMHSPFLLETLLNPDLTAPERPAVLAHEWAHLSGYAPEDDASFVGLLAALRADPGSRYSAWLAIFQDVVSQLPPDEQRQLVARLEAGPRADRRAIAARLQALVEPIARASWEAYDRYLKSQGVEEGIRSYSRVVQLLLGSEVLEDLVGSAPSPPLSEPHRIAKP
jgi:hypothetical protein